MKEVVGQVVPRLGTLGNQLDRLFRVGDPLGPGTGPREARSLTQGEKEPVLRIEPAPVLPSQLVDPLHVGGCRVPAIRFDQQ